MIPQLKAAGLSDNEAKVYLAMLELGPAPVQEIAAKAGINRPTAYAQIEAMKKMGLVSTQTKGKKTLYNPESPEQLKTILDKERVRLDQRNSELEKVLPDLTSLFATKDSKPVVRYFEGVEGIHKMQKEVLKSREKMIRAISSVDDVYASSSDDVKTYQQERLKQKVKTRLIYTSAKGAFLKESDATKLRESRFVPAEKLSIHFDFTVFDDKVILEIPNGQVGGIIIQHQAVADSFKKLFDFMWSTI